MMYTTLNEILKHGPCGMNSGGDSGFSKLLRNLNKTEADDEPLHIMDILKSNGVMDAVWSLRCFDYSGHCLFDSDLAEFVVPIFENEYPDGSRPREDIHTIRNYKLGLDRGRLVGDVYTTYSSAAYAHAAHAVYFYTGSVYAAFIRAATAAAFLARVEELFIKHFGGQNEHPNSAQ